MSGLPLSTQSLTTGVGVASLAGLLVASPQTTVGYQPLRAVSIPQAGTIGAQANAIINNTISNTTSALVSSKYGSYPPSFVFNYEGEQTVTIESDITDHYVEDNTAVQDQIALKPVVITSQGFIAELNDIPPNSAFVAAQTIANKLQSVSGYLPSISVTALIAYNEAVFAYNNAVSLANSVGSLVSAVGNIASGSTGQTVLNGSGTTTFQPNQNQQQTAFQTFYSYWVNRVLFDVQTPYAVFTNMAIKSVRAIQGEDTRVISTFEVTFKQIRTVSTLTTTQPGQLNPNYTQSPLSAYSSQPVSIANSPTAPAVVSVSSLFTL